MSDAQRLPNQAMKPICFLTSALIFFFAATVGVLGQERKFAAYNCAITQPEGWRMVTNLPPKGSQIPSQIVAAFKSPGNSRGLLVSIIDHNQTLGPMDDRSISNVEEGFVSSGGGGFISGKFIKIAGIKGYERLGKQVLNGKQTSMITWLVRVDRRSYILLGVRTDEEVNEDPEIRKGLASFRFLEPPTNKFQLFSTNSPGYRIGYIVGRVGVVVFLIAGVITVIWVTTRRTGKRKASIPPPIPPSH